MPDMEPRKSPSLSGRCLSSYHLCACSLTRSTISLESTGKVQYPRACRRNTYKPGFRASAHAIPCLALSI